jgi:hypothetical protein
MNKTGGKILAKQIVMPKIRPTTQINPTPKAWFLARLAGLKASRLSLKFR